MCKNDNGDRHGDTMEQEKDKIKDILKQSIEHRHFKKLVLSKARDKSVLRSCAVLLATREGEQVMLETFTKDNKAYHKSLTLETACEQLAELALCDYMQTNIITTAGECEIKVSKSGAVYISNKIKSSGDIALPMLHNKEKHRILDEYTSEPFLFKLGICDKNGRIHDKMQSKYRQINRFLELVGDLKSELTRRKRILVYDLCCGKSYLSFALYFYLERVLSLEVEMIGADLKRDVVEYCNSVAAASGMKGLRFICGDIAQLGLDAAPDMVVSLHACDTATDIVLAHAIKSGARMILSTPCCHHELFASRADMSEQARRELDFVLKSSMSAQKLCECFTDSLRAKTLEAYGYSVESVELVTPDDTPKNLLIRARKNDRLSESLLNARRLELAAAREYVGARLTLEKLLSK